MTDIYSKIAKNELDSFSDDDSYTNSNTDEDTFFCRECNKIKKIIIEGFCSKRCRNAFMKKGKCGCCNGSGRVSCMSGGKEVCSACNGTKKGKYTKECCYS